MLSGRIDILEQKVYLVGISLDYCFKVHMDYSNIITMDPGKRSGKPCIRGLRVTVYDVLEYVAAGNKEQILSDFPYLTGQDIQACLAFAADRQRLFFRA